MQITICNPLLVKAPAKRWATLFGLGLYLLACAFLFLQYVGPSVMGENQLRIGADTDTYMAASKALSSGGSNAASLPVLISFQGQILGPVLEGALTGTAANIALANALLFIIGLTYASRLPGVQLESFLPLIVINPITTISILTLNKEIFATLSIILFIRYLANGHRGRILLGVSLFTGLLARWQHPLIMLLFLGMEHRRSPLRNRHRMGTLAVIGCITVIWPLLLRTGVVEMASLLDVAENAQSASLPVLNQIQASFGFPLVLVPKIVGNLFGVPWKVLGDLLGGTDYSDIQVRLVSPMQNLLSLALFLYAGYRGILKLRRPLTYLMVLYIIVSAASPIFQPRYEYPVYVLLCLDIAGLQLPLREERVRAKTTRRIGSILKLALQAHSCGSTSGSAG